VFYIFKELKERNLVNICGDRYVYPDLNITPCIYVLACSDKPHKYVFMCQFKKQEGAG
jgi:hypothetical protein